MKIGQFVLGIVLGAVVAAGTMVAMGERLSGNPAQQPAAKETRLEQVKHAGVLRCGYIVYPPYFTMDNNTGKKGGPFYDITEEIGRQLKLKIEWTGETSWGQMFADLALNRFDMICGPVMETPSRAREGEFAAPLLFTPIRMYARANDTRFDDNLERANQPDVKFASIDGQYTAVVANEDFPKAAKMSLPQMSNGVEVYIAVATGKADAVVSTPYAFADYNKANPNLLRPVSVPPLRQVALGMPVPMNEPSFKATINTTIIYLHSSGFIDKVLKKYDEPVKFIRVAKPYQE